MSASSPVSSAPALALLGGLPMSVAVGTSLLVIAMKSLGGLAGYLSSVQLDWGLVGAVILAAVAGSVVGGRVPGRIPEAALRKGFGWFVSVMGGFVLVQEAPGELVLRSSRSSEWSPSRLARAGGVSPPARCGVRSRRPDYRPPSAVPMPWRCLLGARRYGIVSC